MLWGNWKNDVLLYQDTKYYAVKKPRGTFFLFELFLFFQNISRIRDHFQNRMVPYVPPILGQLLDLISATKINISEPRFESYDPWDMVNCLLWYNTRILKIIIFYCKNPNMSMGQLHSSRVRVQVPEYGSKFPSTGQL